MRERLTLPSRVATNLFSQPLSPMFDESHFPYEYECAECSKVATVTHEDIQDVPSRFATSTVDEAVEHLMTQGQNWFLKPKRGAVCSNCVDGVH